MDILKTIADNESLFNEVKGVVLREFELCDIDDRMGDEILGQQTRARLTGIKLVESAFKKIAKYKTVPEQPKKIMQAR